MEKLSVLEFALRFDHTRLLFCNFSELCGVLAVYHCKYRLTYLG